MQEQVEDRVFEKFREIDVALEKANSNLPNSLDSFLDMDITKDGIYKNIEIAIQSAYDICAIIVKQENFRVPNDEEGIIDILVQEEVLSPNLAANLKDMKGFRNALAHRYGAVDDKVAYENIINGLEDFELFEKEINQYLEG